MVTMCGGPFLQFSRFHSESRGWSDKSTNHGASSLVGVGEEPSELMLLQECEPILVKDNATDSVCLQSPSTMTPISPPSHRLVLQPEGITQPGLGRL